jgi:hypothetical protein
MKIDRALAAAALLLASGALHAYQIIEGRYRVETSPGVFQDLLVVRCDDGRTLTVPWETRLAEACNEGLMGEPLPKAAGKPPVQTVAAAPATAAAEPAKPAPSAPVATQAEAAPALLMDEQTQKEAMLAQVRSQFGNVPEQYIEFKPGADGLSMRFLPPLSDILKKYEACRRARDLSADCGGERDRALARLTNTAAPAAAARGTRPEKQQAAAQKPQPAAPDAPRSSAAIAAPAATQAPATQAAATPAPAPAQPAAQALAPATPERAAVEQKIGEDYAWCMRAKPKFECEQARAKALSELDRPKNGKTKRPAKQAATAAGTVAAAQ